MRIRPLVRARLVIKPSPCHCPDLIEKVERCIGSVFVDGKAWARSRRWVSTSLAEAYANRQWWIRSRPARPWPSVRLRRHFAACVAPRSACSRSRPRFATTTRSPSCSRRDGGNRACRPNHLIGDAFEGRRNSNHECNREPSGIKGFRVGDDPVQRTSP